VRRTVLTVLALLGLLGLGLAVPASVAQADSSQDVGLTGFSDLVVDQTHGHVFISQGTGTVVVTDLAGHRVGALTGLTGAQGMTLSDDGSALFVALNGANAIAEVDTTQPTAAGAVTTFPLGDGSCPTDVAYTAGLVVFQAQCDPQTAVLQALDPSTGTVTDLGHDAPFQTQLVASPSVPDTLFVGDFESQITEYTVTPGATPTIAVKVQGVVQLISHFALTGDGSEVVTDAQASYHTSDLSRVQDFSVTLGRSAVAVRSSDDLIAFGSRQGAVLYRHGATTSLGTYRFDDPDADLVPGGLAFGASTLYAVTSDTFVTPQYALQVITPHNRPRAHVSVAVSKGPYRFGRKETVTVTLHGHTSRAHLELFAATPDGKLHFLKSARPDRQGRMQTRLAMTVNATFIGVFDGDAAVAANVATKRVKVQAWVLGKLFKAQRHAGGFALYKPSQKLLYGIAVGPNKRGQCVFFRAQFRVGGHWGHDATTPCAALTKKSGAAATLQGSPQLAGIPIRIRAEWQGDSFNTRANANWSYAKFTGSARSADKVAAGYGALRVASGSTSAPKIRSPFSQHTARSQSSPSPSLVNPLSWLS
jgi:hypothetical protein